jgi:branched-chain amino acid transport system substrate-binding protein
VTKRHTGKTARSRWLVLLAATAVTLGVTACGSSGGTTASTGSTSSGPLKLSSPVKLAFFWQIQGESPTALNDAQYGALLAVSQINAAGGIGGQPVTWKRYSANISDIQGSISQFLSAAADHPNAIIGIGGSSQLQALERYIAQAQIPTLQMAGADDTYRYGYPGVSKYVYGIAPANDAVILAHVNYATKTLGLKRLGLMCTDEAYGLGACKVAVQDLAAEGLTPVVERDYSPTATDLTPQVLAMKAAHIDGLLQFGFPAPEALQVIQFKQNGLDVPQIQDSSFPFAVDANLVPAADLANDVSAVIPNCNVSPDSTNPGLAQFYKVYENKYHIAPDPYSYEAYDYIYLLKQTIEEAGSDSPAAITQELSTITVTPQDGIVCYPELHADGSHFLGHIATILKYTAQGTPEVISTIETAPTSQYGS